MLIYNLENSIQEEDFQVYSASEEVSIPSVLEMPSTIQPTLSVLQTPSIRQPGATASLTQTPSVGQPGNIKIK